MVWQSSVWGALLNARVKPEFWHSLQGRNPDKKSQGQQTSQKQHSSLGNKLVTGMISLVIQALK